MVLVFVATMVAGAAAMLFGQLVDRPPPRPIKEAPFSWSSVSMASVIAGTFAASMAYLGELLEDRAGFLIAIAVLGPLTAAAWEQRFREIRVYRPTISSPSSAAVAAK